MPIQGEPTSEQVADILIKEVIRNTGVPSEIRSDAAKNLISSAIQTLYKRMGIKITVGTAYHHQLVALVERWHRTLSQLIRVHLAAGDAGWGSKWYRCIPLMELVYNNTINPSTKYTPFFLTHLRHARLPSDLLRATAPELPQKLPHWVQDRLDELNVTYDAAAQSLRLKSITAKRVYDLKHEVNLWYKPGDQVLLIKGSITDKKAIKPKAQLPVDGPFTISKALANDRYILSDLKTRRIREVVHVSRLIPYFNKVAEDEPTWMLKIPPSNGRWPIHGIVDRRVFKLQRADKELGLQRGDPVLQYKVRWMGYDHTWDTWRPLQSLGDIIELVNEYDAINPRPSEFVETLETVPRVSEEPITPHEKSYHRRHMRAIPHPGEKRPPVTTTDAPVIVDEDPADEDTIEKPPSIEDDEREQRKLRRAQNRANQKAELQR